MLELTPINYSDDYKNIRPSLFRESENLDLLLDSIHSVQNKQQEDFLWLSQNILNIDVAQGWHLDFIGGLVGQTRGLLDFNSETYFGFQGSYSSETFGTSTDSDVGGLWNSRSYFNTPTSRLLNDDEYRNLIKARTVFNQSNCDCDSLLEVVNLIVGDNKTTIQILKHGLINIRAEDPSGILAYFIDRLYLEDNILPIAAGVRVELSDIYRGIDTIYESNLYPMLVEKQDAYQSTVKPLDITLKRLLKDIAIDSDAYTPSVKPLDITLRNLLRRSDIDGKDAYQSTVKPLDISLYRILKETTIDDSAAYMQSVKPLDITLKRVLIEHTVKDIDAYSPSVKPLDITLKTGI